MILKFTDVKYNYEIALAWAVSAKNIIYTYIDFSKPQLVFYNNSLNTTNNCLTALGMSVQSFDIKLYLYLHYMLLGNHSSL